MSDVMIVMTAALAAEMLLLVVGLLVYALFKERAARRRDKKAMRVLIARIDKSRGEREATIEEFLKGRMGLVGEALVVEGFGLGKGLLGALGPNLAGGHAKACPQTGRRP